MSIFMRLHKQKRQRNRNESIKRWTQTDEANIINFLKENRDFEQPTGRLFYIQFLEEYEMKNVNWSLVKCKVRNMRRVYRRAKEYEMSKKDSNELTSQEVKNVMLKICWYIDDFDKLFPNEMDNNSKQDSKEHFTNDDNSNQESVSLNGPNSSTFNLNNESLEEQPFTTYLPKSIERDILAVQTGKLNYKRQELNDLATREEEYELAKEQFLFEKGKFLEEIRVREKRIDSRERLKIMELQMKERVAMRELELKQKLALQSTEKQQPFNNVYHNLQ